jgi:tetratricopeptide (TPR) repeat protein
MEALKGKLTDEQILGAMEIIMPGGGEEEGAKKEEAEEGEKNKGEKERGEENTEKGESNLNRQDLGSGKAPFLGVSLTRPQENEIRILGIIPDSPAAHAGLSTGDKILQIEDHTAEDMGNDSFKFLELLYEMPSDRPIRFHIERDTKSFDVWVKLQMLEKDELAKILQAQTDRMNSHLVKGRQLLAENKFADAVNSFQKSLDTYPMESYQGLGISYYHLEKFKEARKNIERAYKLDRTVPLNVFYTAACRDVLGKSNTAIYHYKEYLALNHDNAEMNAFAEERIEVLKSRNGKRLSEGFTKMIDAIIKEIKK